MVKPAWSWADYEREKRAEERKAAKRAAAAEAEAKARHDAASAAAMERIKARSGGQKVSVPPPSRKIDISAAPSGMEAAALRWEGKGGGPMPRPVVPVLCAGEVMCRCGARANGKGRGPVPVWFGEKCIEANCELRGSPRG